MCGKWANEYLDRFPIIKDVERYRLYNMLKHVRVYDKTLKEHTMLFKVLPVCLFVCFTYDILEYFVGIVKSQRR